MVDVIAARAALPRRMMDVVGTLPGNENRMTRGLSAACREPILARGWADGPLTRHEASGGEGSRTPDLCRAKAALYH
jgi:hypothetical protein